MQENPSGSKIKRQSSGGLKKELIGCSIGGADHLEWEKKAVGNFEEKKFYELLCEGNYQLEKVLACNERTRQFGLELSNADCTYLLEQRKEALVREERVEFGEGILPRLIEYFCDSPYISQQDYVETIEELQEVFYLYKNESMDLITDDELLEFMKNQFDGVCQGSLEYLAETGLEAFARWIRSTNGSAFHFPGEGYDYGV